MDVLPENREKSSGQKPANTNPGRPVPPHGSCSNGVTHVGELIRELEAGDKHLLDFIRQAIITYRHPLKVFGMDGTRAYAEEVVRHLQISLTPKDERLFEDGECYVKASNGLEGNVRGHDVFVIQSLYSDARESVSDKFMKLAVFIGSLRQASAYRITAIIPHLAWARQDRKTESRAPVTTKIVAVLLESVGIDHAVFMDVHNLSAEQNAFSLRVPPILLESKNLHADWFAEQMPAVKKLTVLTPDTGGLQRCTRFRNALVKRLRTQNKLCCADIAVAVFDKQRVDGTVQGGNIIGDVSDAEVIVYDDMISTAATMAKACKAVPVFGGRLYAICCTHGLFCGAANKHLDGIPTPIVVSDTVDPFRLSPENRKKLAVVSTTKMVAETIWKVHSGTGSISELLS